MGEHSCQYCYYEDFNEYAYPCSMCVNGMQRKDMFAPKGRRTKAEQTEPSSNADQHIQQPQMGDAKPIPLSTRTTKTEPSLTEQANEIRAKIDDNYRDMLRHMKQTEPKCKDCKYYGIVSVQCDRCDKTTHSNYEPTTEDCSTDGYISGEDFMKIFDADCSWK